VHQSATPSVWLVLWCGWVYLTGSWQHHCSHVWFSLLHKQRTLTPSGQLLSNRQEHRCCLMFLLQWQARLQAKNFWRFVNHKVPKHIKYRARVVSSPSNTRSNQIGLRDCMPASCPHPQSSFSYYQQKHRCRTYFWYIVFMTIRSHANSRSAVEAQLTKLNFKVFFCEIL